MKKIVVSLYFVFFGLHSAGVAYGSLIGDGVTLKHLCPAIPFVFKSTVVAVQEGAGDRTNFEGHYWVDMEAGGILVDFVGNTAWINHPFNGLEVGDLDYGPGRIVSSVEIDTNMSGWDSSRLSFGDDYVRFNWSNLSFNNDSYFNADLSFRESPVPLPAAFYLLGTGLIGLMGLRRLNRRKYIR
ncbi:MAG: VPLPA-CTERM sorting domain-containing protein [Pseudomonadota bacterium]